MSHPRPSCYLAGPIKGLAFDQATQWRARAKADLDEAGIDAFSPMRCKEYLRAESDVGGQKVADSYAQYPLSTMKAITTRDRKDCMKCDAVLMYLLGAKVVSIGSMLEVAWADAARVPVVLVMEKDGSNVHEHGMVREMCGFQVDTLEEGLWIVKAVLLP